MTENNLSRQTKHLNNLHNHFQRRRRDKHLLEIHECHCYSVRDPNAAPVSKGDMVLSHEEKPHGFWKLARVIDIVTDIVTGYDRWVRGAVLRIPSASEWPNILQCPIRWLYSLEIQASHDLNKEETQGRPSVHVNEGSEESSAIRRPRRHAALMARKQIKAWTMDQVDNPELNIHVCELEHLSALFTLVYSLYLLIILLKRGRREEVERML